MKNALLYNCPMKRPVLPFSPAITRDKFVFTSGQVYLTPEGKLLEGTVQEQRETVCVKELPLGARIEISMIAMK